ncbi:MAG TPA: c-type cytochrome [Gemmataceae bacterium]|nr:c-type cytochrome [Gemmataceae bacterium]
MCLLRGLFGRAAAAAALALIGVLACRGGAAAPDAEDLRRGLVTVFQDELTPPTEVVRLEPTIALALQAGESAHPALTPGGTAAWTGYINVLRGGTYRFSLNLRGKFRLTLDGKEAAAGAVEADKPQLIEGPELRLDSGVHRLSAEYTRPIGAARVEVSWKGPGFRTEPLPYEALGYLPKEAPARLAVQAKIDQGRFLAEEHSCVKCHGADVNRMAKTLTFRPGPDLSKIGGRVRAGWIEAWLQDPNKIRPGAAMPALFAADADGSVERYAVAHYLASLGGPVAENPKPPSKKDAAQSAARGEQLFSTIGCAACHSDEKKDKGDAKKEIGLPFIVAQAAHFSLTGLASKTTPEKLAEYLQNPLATDPSGRMPHMALTQAEAADLAHYLCQSEDRGAQPELPDAPAAEALLAALKRAGAAAAEVAALEKAPAAAQADDLGKRLVVVKGCVNCHTIAPGGKPIAVATAFTDLPNLGRNSSIGCLADQASKRGKAPAFAFGDADREALRAFIDDGLVGAGTPAPAFAARETIRQMNCLACHNRDGEGGLSTDAVAQLRKFANAENAEAVAPPTLTGVARKLRTPWMKQVLTTGARARPWMSLRMPQFGEANVGRMPEKLAALEGTEPEDDAQKTPLSAAKIEAGRTLIGKNAFGCISCHDLAGIANTGTRGPDLVGMNQRVRYDWYLRWMEQPQRMQPGTRMPQVFLDGKSLVPGVLNGDAPAQADAVWGYLSLGPGLPLPDGMPAGFAKGMILRVQDKPMLLRTFMPEAGSRAVAIGFPSGVSAVFDAHTCRLAYAWTGRFLDAAPVWDGRGGNPAKVLGPHIWNAPAGCPAAATPSDAPPDFAARAKDPAFGGALPEGNLFDGAPLLHFDGYGLDNTGVPTFHYHLQAGTEARLDVHERIEPLRNGAAAGVARRFSLQVPPQQNAWLLAGECSGEPQLLDAKGTAAPLDLKSSPAEVAAAGKALVLPQDADHVVVLTLAAAPQGSLWRLQKGGAGWQALVRVPSSAADGKAVIDLNVWAPYRNDLNLIKDLLSGR